MPLFDIAGNSLLPVEQKNFTREKELQELIEDNLQAVFNCRFVASELPLQSLTKKDIVKCLKALGVKNSAILNLKWKKELWIQLQFAAFTKN